MRGHDFLGPFRVPILLTSCIFGVSAVKLAAERISLSLKISDILFCSYTRIVAPAIKGMRSIVPGDRWTSIQVRDEATFAKTSSPVGTLCGPHTMRLALVHAVSPLFRVPEEA